MIAPQWAAPAFAQTSAPHVPAPPIKRQVSIATAPERPVPDAGDGEGLEAREVMGADPAAEVAQVMAGTLNAQYAAAPSPLAPPAVVAPAPADPAPPAAFAAVAAPPVLAAAAIPAVARAAPQVLPAVATVSAPDALPSAAAPPEATSSSGPSVALARRVVESAEAFADYMGRASALKPDYVSPAGVSKAVDAGGVYEPIQLQEGAVAYVALVALQDPQFVRTVDTLGREGYRAALVQALAANPRAIMQMPEAAEAAARAAKALGRMGSALMASGAAVKQSAYDMQHSAWSKSPVATPEAMLAELKARSALREVMAQDNGQAMLGTLVQLRGSDADGGSGRLTPAVAQGLTLAALAVLGEAGEEHADRVSALLNDRTSAQCLTMARLNLYQCLSVAGPAYEDAFCLGQHAMMETATCVATASGWAAPARGVSVPVAMTPAAPARPVSVMVPVALGAGDAPIDPQVAAPAFAAAPTPQQAAYVEPGDATPEGAPPPIGR